MWEAEAVWHSHVSHVLWVNRFEMWPLTILSLHVIHPVIPCHAMPPPSTPFSPTFSFFQAPCPFSSELSFHFLCAFTLLINSLFFLPSVAFVILHLWYFPYPLTLTFVWLCCVRMVSFVKPQSSISVRLLFLLPCRPLVILISNHSPSASQKVFGITFWRIDVYASPASVSVRMKYSENLCINKCQIRKKNQQNSYFWPLSYLFKKKTFHDIVGEPIHKK